MTQEGWAIAAFAYAMSLVILVTVRSVRRSEKRERARFELSGEENNFNRRTAHLLTLDLIWPVWIPIGIAYGIYRYVRVMVKGY